MIRTPPIRAMDALRRLVRALLDSAHALEKQAGITPAQRFVLQQLADGPLPTVNALASRTHTNQATVSVVLDRLEARGLVVRQRGAEDRRRTPLTLTATGRKLLNRSIIPAQAGITAALATMPARQVRSLATALEAWVVAAGLTRIPAGLFLEPDAPAARRRIARG
jgi:DNA-binding MarR family transcriptional regulator